MYLLKVYNMPVTVTKTPDRAMTNKGHILTRKQEQFCQIYVQSKGDSYQSVIKAGYNVKDGYNKNTVIRMIAHENLTKPYIIDRINELLNAAGYNDATVKTQHSFLIEQHKDYNAKARGIDMYYKVLGKYAPEKGLKININYDIEEGDKERLKELLK